MAAYMYCSNCGHCVFEPPSWGSVATHDVHLGFIEKRVVDFLLVLIELFTALHVMQTRYSDENSVHLSVRLSHACIVTKRKIDLSTFLHYTKDNLA